MKKYLLLITAMIGLTLLTYSQLSAQDATLTGANILDKVDDVVNAPKDQDLKMKLVLIDKDGAEKVREMVTLQKGADRRMAKFLSPADQKGIAFLSLPDDVMYLYLPAFKKTRRIASHVKNTKFAGTDFTYEDMEAKRYAEKWIPELQKNEGNFYILQLTPKAGVKTDYSKMVMWARADNFYPTKIEHYNRAGKLCKIMTRDNIEKVSGYWTFKVSEMQDLNENHKTKMIMTETKFDTGLAEEIFTERYLSR